MRQLRPGDRDPRRAGGRVREGNRRKQHAPARDRHRLGLGRYWLASAASSKQSVRGGWRRQPELVTSGPYRFARHPIYSGLLTAILGTASRSGTSRPPSPRLTRSTRAGRRCSSRSSGRTARESWSPGPPAQPVPNQAGRHALRVRHERVGRSHLHHPARRETASGALLRASRQDSHRKSALADRGRRRRLSGDGGIRPGLGVGSGSPGG
jgi:hypothetical protein